MNYTNPQEQSVIEAQTAPRWRRVLPVTLALTSIVGFNACTDDEADMPPTATAGAVETVAPAITALPPTTPGQISGTPPFETLSTAAPETTLPANAGGPFELTGSPELDAQILWYEQQDASPPILRVSDAPLMPAPELGALPGQDISEAAVLLTKAEFMVGFEHQSGLLVNVYKGDLHKPPRVTEDGTELAPEIHNGMPDIAIEDPKGLAITLQYAIDNIRQANSINGYFNEQELQFIETLSSNRSLVNNELKIIFVNDGPLCAEDIYPTPPEVDPLAACPTWGGMRTFGEVVEPPVPHRSAVILVRLPSDNYVPGNYLPEQQLDYEEMFVASTVTHEETHYLAAISGAYFRHGVEAFVRANQEATLPDGRVDEARRTELQKIYNAEMFGQPEEDLSHAVGEQMLNSFSINKNIVPQQDPATGQIIENSLVYIGRPPFSVMPIEIHS